MSTNGQRFMDSRYKKLGANTLLVFIGRAGSALIGMLMLPFYTNWLSPEEYGTYDLVYTYSLIILGVVTCSISDSIFVYPKTSDSDGKTRYFTSGLTFSIVTIIFCGFTLWGLSEILKDRVREYIIFQMVWIVIGMVASSFLQLYVQSFTRAIDKMKVYGITGIVQTLSIAMLSLILIPRLGLTGYFIALIIANFVAATFSFLCSKSYKYLNWRAYDNCALKELLKYGIPLVPSGIMWWLVNGFNKPIIESEIGLTGLGIFAVANKFPALITLLFTIFANAWNITLLEEFGNSDFNNFFNRTVKFLFFVMILSGCVLSSISYPLILIIANPSYLSAWVYIPILIIGVIIQNFAGIIGGIFSAMKQSKYILYSSVVGGLSSIVFTIAFIKLWGLTGVCISIAASFLIISIIRLIFAWRYINLLDLRYILVLFLTLTIYVILIVGDLNPVFSISCQIILLTAIILSNRTYITRIGTLFVQKIHNIKSK